jgi:hypothetical protein
MKEILPRITHAQSNIFSIHLSTSPYAGYFLSEYDSLSSWDKYKKSFVKEVLHRIMHGQSIHLSASSCAGHFLNE